MTEQKTARPVWWYRETFKSQNRVSRPSALKLKHLTHHATEIRKYRKWRVNKGATRRSNTIKKKETFLHGLKKTVPQQPRNPPNSPNWAWTLKRTSLGSSISSRRSEKILKFHALTKRGGLGRSETAASQMTAFGGLTDLKSRDCCVSTFRSLRHSLLELSGSSTTRRRTSRSLKRCDSLKPS